MWIRIVAVAALLAVIASAQDPSGGITAIGSFFNPRFAEENTDGYTVQLWKQGELVFGLLSVEALSGDGPVGTLTNIKFEERSGKLSFDAKLSTGMRLMANNSQQASRDLYRFRGAIAKDTLAGTMTHSDVLDTAAGETSVKIRLTRQPTGILPDSKTYAAWKSAADELLRLRGPKWQ